MKIALEIELTKSDGQWLAEIHIPVAVAGSNDENESIWVTALGTTADRAIAHVLKELMNVGE